MSIFAVIKHKYKIPTMSEVELYLIKDGENCTIYTLQFLHDVESEFEKLLRQEAANGNVNITESTIETDNIFEL